MNEYLIAMLILYVLGIKLTYSLARMVVRLDKADIRDSSLALVALGWPAVPVIFLFLDIKRLFINPRRRR